MKLTQFSRRSFLAGSAALRLARPHTMNAKSSSYLDYLGVDLAQGGVQSDLSDLIPYRRMQIGGVPVTPATLPKGVVHREDLGVAVPEWVDIRVLHRFPQPAESPKVKSTRPPDWTPAVYVDCPRPFIAPNGDYVLTIISGKAHYGNTDPHCKVNDILLYRSTDHGKTWRGPGVAWNLAYNQHAAVPLIPKGANRIYCFGTEPAPGDFDGRENAGLAMRFSDDNGFTWSAPQRINPANDPGFQGMWCINAAQTERGTWLIAPHEGDWSRRPLRTRLYVLRSEDRGRTWQAAPDKRPNGWFWPGSDRMDEGRPLALDGGNVALFTRTTEGHIWSLRSKDDGRTWSEPKPTPLIHPDAPPMIEKLSDGSTIIALHHNRHTGGGFNRDDRSELWVSRSTDGGFTWTQPRFLAVTCSTTTRRLFGTEQYCMTYCDVLARRGRLHIFIPHLWRQVLEIRMKETDLDRLPERKDLFGAGKS